MAWKLRTASYSVFCSALVLSPSSVFSQQTNLQTSFFAPAAAHLYTAGVLADVAETEHLPYINQVAKENPKGLAAFQPNASDLLIQRAEEKYRNGKRFYQIRDYEHARLEFDGAIDDMLKASENPTDHSLFESKLEEMVDTIHHYDLSGMGASVVEVAQFDKAPLEDIVQMTFPVDPSITNKVKSEVKMTSSALPLVVNDVVLGYINYFNGRGRRTIEYGLARAAKYRPMISKILAEEGVPQELIYLAQAESGFLPRAVSRAAAQGMWQFVKFRGNEYGLMQTPYSDDRFDPEKSTRAAARHLRDLYNEFHDWYLAIAAYNCGPGGVERAVERTGYADYWELRARHAIPAETTNYVPIILAMTIMAKNAPEYGLENITPEAALEYESLDIDSPTNLALIADLADAPAAELQQLNPALLRGLAPGGYQMHVPKGTSEQVKASLSLISADRRASWRVHRVEAGDTLASISHHYNTSVGSIAEANQLGDSEPNSGDRLLIPASYRETIPALKAPVQATRTMARSTRKTSARNNTRTVAARKSASPSGNNVMRVSARRPLHPTAGLMAQAARHPRTVSR